MNIVKLTIHTKQELVKSYIKQFKNGGIFVKGNFDYSIGDDIFLILTINELNHKIAVNGTVCWKSPPTSISSPSGVGIQFNNDKVGASAKDQIEIHLGGAVESQKGMNYTL